MNTGPVLWGPSNVAPFGIKEGPVSQGHVYSPFLISLPFFLLSLSLSLSGTTCKVVGKPQLGV